MIVATLIDFGSSPGFLNNLNIIRIALTIIQPPKQQNRKLCNKTILKNSRKTKYVNTRRKGKTKSFSCLTIKIVINVTIERIKNENTRIAEGTVRLKFS